jgi:hypothetical protein
MEFLSMADDEDIQDFTDVAEGRDFTVDTVGPDTTGTAYNKSSIRPKTKISPLAQTKEQISKFLEEQPNPIDAFTIYSFEEMKEALQNWLNPEDNTSEDNEEENNTDNSSNPLKTQNHKAMDTDLPWDNKPSNNYSLKTSSVKKDNKTKFDDLFDEEN